MFKNMRKLNKINIHALKWKKNGRGGSMRDNTLKCCPFKLMFSKNNYLDKDPFNKSVFYK